jgi:hypothetical protein
VPDLDEALDELYAASLDDFVDTRKRLAKALKDEGHSDDAAALAATRKPTVAAWAVNELARSRRKDVDSLLDAGHRLRRAQAALLRGEGASEFAAARKAQQSAVAKLGRVAQGALAKNASRAVLDQVTGTLEAASVSDEGRDLLARGRFEKPFTETAGFDALTAFAPAAPRRRKPEPDPRAQLRDAKAELKEAERAQRRLERAAADAERLVERRKVELADAEERARDARGEAEAAAKTAAQAARRVRSLEREG